MEIIACSTWLEFYFILVFFFFLQGCTHGIWSSQARGWIGAATVGLCHSHSNPDPCLVFDIDIAHSNARSLTQWVRPGIEPASSWILVRFVTTEPQWDLPMNFSFIDMKAIKLTKKKEPRDFFPFLRPLLQHMEVLRLGAALKLQLLARP